MITDHTIALRMVPKILNDIIVAINATFPESISRRLLFVRFILFDSDQVADKFKVTFW